MRTVVTFSLAGAAALMVGCAPAAPEGPPGPIAELAGRVAGPPQTCVPIESSSSIRLVDRHTLIYNTGPVVWLNRTNCPASSNDVLVFHPTGSQHCRGDIVGTFERLSRIPGPSCVLGDFVPYRRP
jgi:hypothetical protein